MAATADTIAPLTHDPADGDSTRNRRADDRFRQQQQDELAHVARVNTLGEIAAGLAHELNQPLTAVCAYVETARHLDQPTVEDLMAILDKIETQSRRAADIIAHMRASTRKRRYLKELVEPAELIRQTVELAIGVIRDRGARVTLLPGHDVPVVEADPVQIQQVLLNLIINGLDAMADTPIGRRCLTISWSSGDGQVEIQVSDNGPGLTVEQANRMFEPFFTTKPNGMGLGLSISRSIMQAHGGRLWAAQDGTSGATFHIQLPAAQRSKLCCPVNRLSIS